MKKYEIVKSKEEFNYIINKGEKIANKHFIIFFMKQDAYNPKFGIAVSKKLGNAVMRNKIKRQVRNIIDIYKNLFPKKHNYIIIIKKAYLDEPYQELKNSLEQLVRKVKDEK